eukprot:14152371-Heterocapsa_arctica.AAC.1
MHHCAVEAQSWPLKLTSYTRRSASREECNGDNQDVRIRKCGCLNSSSSSSSSGSSSSSSS